jgi:DNA-binding transcriptional MocR family regulator
MDKPKLRFDFLKGHPNDNELPVEELHHLFQSVESESLRSALQYGQGQGNPTLISELESFIIRQCASDVGNDATGHIGSMFITEGVSHGVDLLTSAATQPGDYVLTEHPTYFLIADIFRSHQLNVGTLPMRAEDGGIDLDALEKGFETGLLTIPRLIYIIPSHHNPTGRCMSNADRERITTLAHQYKILVIADEVYHLLDWGGQPRSARMVTWNASQTQITAGTCSTVADKKSRVSTCPQQLYGCVSVSSFTKIFGPGVRCGWIEADHSVVKAVRNIGYIQSQGAVAPVMGTILSLGLSSRTVDRVLQRLRDRYEMRCNLLCDILEHDSSIRLTCRPTGGYFVWIQLPEIMNLQAVNKFSEYCMDNGLRFMPGTRCDACPVKNSNEQQRHVQKVEKYALHSYARFCFVKLNSNDIENGATLFLQCLRSYMKVELGG